MSNNKPSFGRRKAFESVNSVVSRATEKPKNYIQRRSEPERVSQFKSVVLVYNDGYSTCNAVLRSLSELGAKIETEEGLHLPDTFIMKSQYRDFYKKCHLIWRDENFVGVKFMP